MTAAQRSPRSGGRLRPRTAAWTAWSLWAVVVVLTVLAMVLVVVIRSVPHGPYDQWQLVWLRMSEDLAFATVGLIVASHRPANPLGWLLLAFGLSLSANEFLRAYADYTLVYQPGTLPAGLAIAWVATWIWAFIFPILPFVFLLFPDGGLPSPRWRPFAWVAGLVNGLFALMVPFRAGGLEYFPAIPNPVGIPALTEAVFEALHLSPSSSSCWPPSPCPYASGTPEETNANSSSGWRTPRSSSESWELSRRDGLPPWSA